MTVHDDVFARIESLLEDEDDWVSAMSTVPANCIPPSNIFTGPVFIEL